MRSFWREQASALAISKSKLSSFHSAFLRTARVHILFHSPLRTTLQTVTPDDLKRLPFGEIAEAFSRFAHSRRMAGTLIALYPNAGRFHVLARTCMSPEFVEALGDTENQVVATEPLKAGQLPAKRVRELAEMAPNISCSFPRCALHYNCEPRRPRPCAFSRN